MNHVIPGTIYLFIYLCKSYQGTRKIMQKAQKEGKKQKKHTKNTSHDANIFNNRLYI